LEEGERFSLKYGRLIPEARQRVRSAITEIVTAEEDLKTKIRDPKLAKVMDEIKVKQRDLRKWVWAEGLTTTQEDIGSLGNAITQAKELVDLTYEAAELEGNCPTCEELMMASSEGEMPTWVYLAFLSPVILPFFFAVCKQFNTEGG